LCNFAQIFAYAYLDAMAYYLIVSRVVCRMADWAGVLIAPFRGFERVNFTIRKEIWQRRDLSHVMVTTQQHI
jgi:hypothetical protein